MSGYSGDGGLATDAELDYPDGVAVDAGGDLFIADTYNSRIREVNAEHARHRHRRRQRNLRAIAATAGRPPLPSSLIPKALRWTPAETCSSPTPTTTAVREVQAPTINVAQAPLIVTANNADEGLPRGRCRP